MNRLVLERCKSTEKAVQLLRELPHHHSFTYSVFDSRGDAAVIEATPEQTEVHRSR